MAKYKPKIVKKVFRRIGPVTICLIREQCGNVFRGVSICSNDDNCDDEFGRIEAERYAIRAMKGRGVPPIRSMNAIRIIAAMDVKAWDIWSHGDKNPCLSDGDVVRLLTKQERRDAYEYNTKTGLRVYSTDIPF